MNVAICTPTTGSVKAQYTTSLLGMVTHYLNNPVFGLEPDCRKLSYTLLIGSNIAEQREQLVEQALAAEDPISHVLFLDDDMAFGPECLNIALSRQEPIVLANYRKKNPPWSFTARRMLADNKTQEVVTDDMIGDELERVDFGGFGFCLIEKQTLLQMTAPRFCNLWVDGHHTTEDYPFFKQILDRKLAYVLVDHAISRNVWHVGDYTYHYSCGPMGLRIRKKLWDSGAVVQEFKVA